MGENKFLAPSIVLEGSKHLQEAKTRWVYNPDILSYIIKNSTKNQRFKCKICLKRFVVKI